MDSGIGRSCDRISNLPDSILCHILSFLPTKYAVGTSILSTRWLYLWTYLTSFEFDDSELLYECSEPSGYGDDEVDLSFMKFVNGLLLLSDVPCWEKFSLRLRSFSNFDLVCTWVNAAIKRNVQKLELCYFMKDKSYLYSPVELPRLIFTSKTLVDLTLEGSNFLKLPASVWLPSLKILNLEDLKFENEDSAWKLFSGCPVLEELTICGCLLATPIVLNISVPTLKRLMVFLCGSPDVLFKADDQRYKLVVNAPKLEHLHLADSLTEDFSLENLPSLLKADVHIREPYPWSHRSPDISKLLGAIANVKFLDFQTGFFNGVLLLPTFDNLTRLRFGGLNSWNLDMLREFLQHSPNLEVLILEGTSVLGSAKPWSPPPQVPYCLLFHLKELEILKFCEKDYGLEEIEYLLKNAIVLKKMTIDCQYPVSCFCKALAGFPRGSKTCQLNLPH